MVYLSDDTLVDVDRLIAWEQERIEREEEERRRRDAALAMAESEYGARREPVGLAGAYTPPRYTPQRRGVFLGTPEAREQLGEIHAPTFQEEQRRLYQVPERPGIGTRLRRAGLETLGQVANPLLVYQERGLFPRLPRGLQEAAETVTSPITALTAGYGGPAAAALRATRLRPLAGFVEPIVSGGFGRRLAAETAVGTGAYLAAEEAGERGGPLVGLAAGLGAGVGVIGGIRAGERGVLSAERRMATRELKRQARLTIAPDLIPGEETLTFFTGTNRPLKGDRIRKGMFVTPLRDDAERYAKYSVKLSGGSPRVYTIEVAPDALAATEGFSGSRGAMTVQNPRRARVVEPTREALAGGVPAGAAEQFLTPGEELAQLVWQSNQRGARLRLRTDKQGRRMLTGTDEIGRSVRVGETDEEILRSYMKQPDRLPPAEAAPPAAEAPPARAAIPEQPPAPPAAVREKPTTRTPNEIRADLANAWTLERRAEEIPGLRAELHEALVARGELPEAISTRRAVPEQPTARPAGRPQPEAAPPTPPAGAPPAPPIQPPRPPFEPPRGRPPSGSFEDALQTMRREVRRQLQERRAGITAGQIQKGRQRQVASFREAFAQAEAQGLQGFEAEQAARRTMAGALTEVPPLENVAPEHFDAIVEGVSTSYRDGAIREFQFINELKAIRNLRDGGPALQPRQIDTLRHILGEDLTDLLVERQRSFAGAQPEQRTALEQLGERFAKEAEVLRATNQPFRAAQQAQEQMLNALRNFDRLSAGQADRVRLAGLKKLSDLDAAEVKRLRGYLDNVAITSERREVRAVKLTSRTLQRIAEARDVSEIVGPIREAGDEDALRAAIGRAMETGDERIRAAGQRAFDRMDELQRTQTARYNQMIAQQGVRAEARTAAQASQRAAAAGVQADVRNYRQRLNSLLRDFRNARRAGDLGIADRLEVDLRRTIDDALAAGDDPIKHAGIRAQIAMESRLPNADAMLLKARSLLAERKGPFENVSEEARRTLLNLGDNWIEANRILLDGQASELGGLYQIARSVLTGELPDSYLTALVTRRGFLTVAAEQVLDDPKLARQYADALMERELILRYGKNRPEKVKEILDLTKRTTGELDPDFWDTLVQRGKNTAFGIGDFGVWGVNVARALAQGNIPMFAGVVNRALTLAHLPHIQLELLDNVLSKRMVYALDGLHYGVGPSAVRAKEGTILQYIPVAGKYVDMPFIAVADGLNRLQYEMILNPVREIIYEGNLVMQRLLGRDIRNPAVRAAAVENANALSSFGRTALRAGRAKAERTLLTSSPMTRSQFATLLQISKLVRTGATADERIMAAMTIASTAGAMLFVGKWLNDQIGVDEFEFNPAKRGFGDIELSNDIKINLFSQQSLVKAIARSFDALRQGDPEEAAKAGARFWLGRTSLVGETIGAAFGTGYEPGRGFVFGEMEQGIAQRALNLAPMPPIAQSMLLEGTRDPFLLGIEGLGITAFPESAWEARRELRDEKARQQGFTGWDDPKLNDAIRKQINDDPEVKALTEKAETQALKQGGEFAESIATGRIGKDILKELAEKGTVNGEPVFNTTQAKDNGLLTSGDIGGKRWRDRYSDRQDIYYAYRDAMKAALKVQYPEKEYTNEVDKAIDAYFKVRPASYVDDVGETDWDRYFADKDAAYEAAVRQGGSIVAEYLRPEADDPTVREYKADVAKIRDSGYWELADQIMSYFYKNEKITGAEGMSYKEFWPWIEDWYTRYAEQDMDRREPGWRQRNSRAAADLAAAAVRSLRARFNQGLAKTRKWFHDQPQNRGIQELLLKWEYDILSREEAEEAAGLPPKPTGIIGPMGPKKPREPIGVR